MLDTGTTTSFLARELLGHRRLTVVTNSSDIARTLATANGNRCLLYTSPSRHPQRHRDKDRGKGDHGAVPLAEDRDKGKAGGHQQRKACLLYTSRCV